MTTFFRILFVSFLAVFPLALQAQDQESLSNEAEALYPLWEDIANSAEEIIDDPESTNKELEDKRATIVGFRAQFSSARSVNDERIRTLQNQLDALGPVPENGDEPSEVAVERTELERRLEELLAPARVADAAFYRAEGLVSEIDTIIRERQARRLLELGPSPLDPRNWPLVWADTDRMLDDFVIETKGMGQRFYNREARDRMPLILLLVVVAMTLIVKGRQWASSGVEFLRKFGGRGSGVWSFLVSLLRILVPLAGLLLLTYAIEMTNLLGETAAKILALIPWLGLIILGFRWLSERLFSRVDEDALILTSSEKRKSARRLLFIASVFFVLRVLLGVVFSLESAEPETIAVSSFPFVVVLGLILSLFGLTLRKYTTPTPEPDEEEDIVADGSNRVVTFLGTVMIVVGLAAPTMAAVGYAEAGNALLYPTIASLALVGLVFIFQRFFTDVYGMFSGQGAEARDGLMAIFIWFVLLVLSLPVFALIWGARVTDLTEIWTQFLLGFDIGGTRIAPADFLAFAILFSAGYGLTRVIQSTLRSSVLPKTRMDIGGQNAVVSGVGYVGITLAAVLAITGAGLDLSGIAIVAGALSVGIGFGLQTIVSNFVSGVILLIERPISEGDWIEVGGQMGYVKDISVRATRIETFDRTDVIVPNSDFISGTVTNFTRGNTIGRLIVKVGVAYGSDTKKVGAILLDIAKAQPLVLNRPPPNVMFVEFGASALEFEIRAILRDVNWILSVKNDINHEIAAKFAEEGIEIPFAQRDIWLRNPEALHTEKEVDE